MVSNRLATVAVSCFDFSSNLQVHSCLFVRVREAYFPLSSSLNPLVCGQGRHHFLTDWQSTVIKRAQ